MAARLAMKNPKEDRDQLEDASIEDLYKKFPFTKNTKSKTDPSKQGSHHSKDNSTIIGSKSAAIDDFRGGATMGF